MEERGRMGAHPASNSIFHEETVRSYKPAPGISRMPPIPMKLNMKMNAGGPATPVSQPKLGGTLALITPVYAVGIIVFFVFTLWKVGLSLFNNISTFYFVRYSSKTRK